jgi:glucose-6-phosphate 1-epimerase
MDGGKRKTQTGPVTIGAETDRIYLDTSADCLIDDPGLKRRIRIRKRGSHSTVVWNPWIEKSVKMGDFGENGYLNMVCVESTNAADDVVTIAPGGEHRLWVRYETESMVEPGLLNTLIRVEFHGSRTSIFCYRMNIVNCDYFPGLVS